MRLGCVRLGEVWLYLVSKREDKNEDIREKKEMEENFNCRKMKSKNFKVFKIRLS